MPEDSTRDESISTPPQQDRTSKSKSPKNSQSSRSSGSRSRSSVEHVSQRSRSPSTGRHSSKIRRQYRKSLRRRSRSRSSSAEHISRRSRSPSSACHSKGRKQYRRSSRSRRRSRSRSRSRSERVLRNPPRRLSSTTDTNLWRQIKKTRIVAALNVSLHASKNQLEELFANCGKIRDIAIFPPVQDLPFASGVPYRICFIKYAYSSCSRIALHLTGTVFLDRSLFVVPCEVIDIPEEEKVWDVVSAGAKQLIDSSDDQKFNELTSN